VTEAAAGRRERTRLPAVSAVTFRRAAYAALVALVLVTVSGATVRLTGSGLGCDNWPRCGQTSFLPEQGYHAYVEFSNRVVGFLVGLTTLAAAFTAWRARVPRQLLIGAVALPLLVLAQGVLGGITVIFELNPYIVMGHFLLSLAGVALGVWVVVGAERLTGRLAEAPTAAWLGWLALALVPLALVLVVTGAFSTASGPHSGGADIRRIWNLEDAVYVHVRATAIFGLGFLVVLVTVLRSHARVATAVGGATLAVLLAQMAVGEAQWRNQLPWWLVLVHVTLATLVWGLVVTLAAVLPRRRNSLPLP
jgi:cytochrome c oxidase assembly protein subunit 15